jgi:Mn-containing catalase
LILRVDKVQAELPPPSDPDPVGAAAVQELMGGRFGEMSTFMNYTDDDKEIVAVLKGPHPETGEGVQVVDEAPEGFQPQDPPSQSAVFAPDYAPEEIAEKLRKDAGL